MFLSKHVVSYLRVWIHSTTRCILLFCLIVSASGKGKQLNPISPPVHPLTPLNADEIQRSSNLIRANHLNNDALAFVSISLHEPTKAEMMEYSRTRSESKHVDTYQKLGLFAPPRKSFSVFFEKRTGKAFEATVNLSTNQVSFQSLPPGIQPALIGIDAQIAFEVSDQSPEVLSKLRSLGFPNSDNIVFDAWPASQYQQSDVGKRILSVYLYFTEFKGDNEFAHPLSFITIVDVIEKKLLRIVDLPIYENSSTTTPNQASLPRRTANFDPTILVAENKHFYRKDSRPLRTRSESGPSFTLNGYQVTWQKFNFRFGFNVREGLVIYDVSYQDGANKRPLIYRAAMSEMIVPYGDPNHPYQYKAAFDQGEFGLGLLTRSLRPNAECFKDGRLIDVLVNSDTGNPSKIPNAICIHEEDGGLLHKHTTHGRVTAARAQILVIHFSITADNYDYLFHWRFHQDATISYEVGLTGLLSTNLFLGENSRYGTIVSHGVIAHYHQHIFCVRVDTAFDGEENTVSTVDVVVAPDSDNPTGHGFTTKETVLRTSKEAVTDTNLDTDRVWKISNPKSFNSITKEPVSWKLVPMNQQLLQVKPGSLTWKRAQFAAHAVWVTQYRDYELNAAGNYPTLSVGEDGLPTWIKRNEPIVGRDIVLWHSFGVTHIPRLEDYPIMGLERVGFTLKPCNFFTSYPGLDVPAIETN